MTSEEKRPKRQPTEAKKQLAKGIAARLSRGNVSIQLARYQTSEDIRRKREKVLKWDFD